MAIVRVNPRLEAELTGGRFDRGPLEAALGQVADEIAARARAIARVEAYDTGAYHDSIRGESGDNEQGELVGRVVADDWKAHLIEFGYTRADGVHVPGRNILARAAEQAGPLGG